MAQIRRAYTYLGISFLAITQLFLSQSGESLYRHSGDYYLSIGDEKSKL